MCNGLDFKFGLYSAKWWWGPATGDSHKYSHLPWWVADYDGIPNTKVFKQFAGIKEPEMKQYASTTYYCDLQVDLNVYRTHVD